MIICPEYKYIYISSISKPSLLKTCVYINICILTTNNGEYTYVEYLVNMIIDWAYIYIYLSVNNHY
jgi:hypothetical protein